MEQQPLFNLTIAGPQGSGKSRLAESLEYDLQQRGFAVFIDPFEQPEAGRVRPLVVIRTRQDEPETRSPILLFPTGVQINADIASVHQQNVDAGWWTDLATGESLIGKRNVGEMLMLVTSELAEGAEGDEYGLNDDKLPHRPMLEVELADAKIRILDLGGGLNLDLGGAFDALVRQSYWNNVLGLNTAECLMRIAREVSAAMEGHRKNAKDKLFPGRLAIEVRLAAALVLIHQTANQLGYDLDGAVAEKRAFNASRADHKLENRRAAGGKAY